MTPVVVYIPKDLPDYDSVIRKFDSVIFDTGGVLNLTSMEFGIRKWLYLSKFLQQVNGMVVDFELVSKNTLVYCLVNE